MKNLFLTLVVFSVLFIIGCQENSITDPTQSLSKRGDLNTEETINLSWILSDPTGGSCHLTGEVTYVHQILNSDMDEDGLYLISLTLEMNSLLSKLDGPVTSEWTINDQSEDIFYVSEEGIYILDKVYMIENRSDIVLVVQYLVTTEGAGIPNLWLQEID